MIKQAQKNNRPLSTKELMTILVSQYQTQCIHCHHCMDVCPVTKGVFTIQELNTASAPTTEVPAQIKEFAFNCVQCGKCVPVCPINIRRDYMVRYIKHKLREQKPWSYKRYLLIKGRTTKRSTRLLQNIYRFYKKKTVPDLACFMETIPQHKADVLFYPGCYIYSKKTVRQTLRLLDHLGSTYAVLGGVTHCCGAPHMLQGEFEKADRCLEELHQNIKANDPKIIITSCAECFEILNTIKTLYDEKYELLSVTQYLLLHADKFPDIKNIRKKIMVHDSCRFSKQSAQGTAARRIVSRYGELVEPDEGKESVCCFHWNHGYDTANKSRRSAYLSEVNTHASTLACTCLTCYEQLIKTRTNVEIIDILQLFTDACTTGIAQENTDE